VKDKKVQKVLEFIEEYVGEVGAMVFKKLLESGKEILDPDLSSELNIEENNVRRALYELHNLGLVNYRRVRNPADNKYIYYWRVDSDRINHVLLQRKKNVLKKLMERLEYEEGNTFYICPVDGVRLTFEEAMENDFRCPRCGEMLVFEDNAPVKQRLGELITKLREEILDEEKTLGR
jgi:transcription initiation factor TFIIE subunit alpha